MKIEDAYKIGFEGWAFRLSGDNILAANIAHTNIYTDERSFEIKNYSSDKTDDWIPLPEYPEYLPKDMKQNHNWFRAKYRKFREEELNIKVNILKKKIEELEKKIKD